MTPSFTGWTFMNSPTAADDGTVNFAVYSNPTGHNWATDLGISVSSVGAGNPAVDTKAAFVYFYQVVNNGPGGKTKAKLGGMDVYVAPDTGSFFDPYTSFGKVNGTGTNGAVFTDTGGAVGPSGNQYLGDPTVMDNKGAAGTTKKTVTPGFTSNSSAVNPSGVDTSGVDDGVNFVIRWTFRNANGGPIIADQGYSSVVFMTSNYRPTYGTGTLRDGDRTAGSVPVATPEPASFALMACGAFGFGLAGWRKLRRKEVV